MPEEKIVEGIKRKEKSSGKRINEAQIKDNYKNRSCNLIAEIIVPTGDLCANLIASSQAWTACN